MITNPVPKGTWVQIRQQILSAGERAPQVPQDTAKVPLVMLVKGFLQAEANLGDQVEVKTLSHRIVKGELVEVMPRYTHDFGNAVPELLEIGPKIRELLEGGRD